MHKTIFFLEWIHVFIGGKLLRKSLGYIRILESSWLSEWLQSDDVKFPLHSCSLKTSFDFFKCIFQKKIGSIISTEYTHNSLTWFSLSQGFFTGEEKNYNPISTA